MLANVAQAAAEQNTDEEIDLLARRPEKRILLLVITADRGLAGAFNSNVIRGAQKFIAEHRESEVLLELIGRKGRDFFRRRHAKITGEYTTLFQKAVRHEDALEIARKVIELFRTAEVDSVHLVVNNFKSMMASQLITTRLLPLEFPEKPEQIDYIYEQPPGELLATLLPRYIEVADLSRRARIRRGPARCAHDRHGSRQFQRNRCHQFADAADEPGAASQHY